MASGTAEASQRSRVADRLLSLAVAVLVFVVLASTLPDEVLQGDPGEFQLAAAIGGLAHPTGYPLYLLVGWLWTKLPFTGSAAYAMNLLSALFAAAAAGVTARLVLELGPRAPVWLALPTAAWAAVAMSLAPTYWSQSIVAEVYTLHCLLWALLALATLRLARRPSLWWIVGLLAGLGLAHHRMTILYLPAVVACLALERPAPVRVRDLAAAVTALLLPLALYAYVPLRAPDTPYLRLALAPGDTLTLYRNDPAGFLSFVSGSAFEGALTLSGLGTRAGTALSRTQTEMTPALLALAGAVWLARRRLGAAVLLVAALVTNVAFNLIYNIGDINVFYLPVYLTAAVLSGAAVIGWGSGGRRRAAIAGLVLLAVVVGTAVQAPAARRAALAIPHAPADLWPAVFEAAPSNAIILSNDRNEIVPMWYYQYAEGWRPDLLGLFPLISTEPEYADIGALIGRALGTGRPVCLVKEMPGIEVGYRPEASDGPPYCLTGVWDPPPPRNEQALSDEVTLLGYDVPDEPPAPGTQISVTLYWQVRSPLTEPYSTYVHVLDESGAGVWGGSDHRPGGVYLPATLWQPGQVIRDEHVIEVPADAAPGSYRLLTGMYEYPSLNGYGQALTLGDRLVVSSGQ